ncbi:MAG: tetratricopeptide repeat protein [Alphaproteobacteria bacterium]|nr:tetratricopeptide repeat protein [Alphaproteobacteria bacterium]
MRHYTTILSLLLLLTVAGCKTTDTPLAGGAIDSLSGKSIATEKRLSTAAANAVAEGKTDEALDLYEKLYTRNNGGFFAPGKSRQDVALNYAQLLRKTGKAQRALVVLAPFAENIDGGVKASTDPIVLNEYAAASIELGNLEKAEKILNHVLKDENAAEFHADANNLLGIVFDAEGKHKEAEPLFRKALGAWKGDSTSVMNNLAVCLANLGMFDEALTTLNQALIMAPDKHEIASNIEMVENLRQSLVSKPKARAKTPKSKKKQS